MNERTKLTKEEIKSLTEEEITERQNQRFAESAKSRPTKPLPQKSEELRDVNQIRDNNNFYAKQEDRYNSLANTIHKTQGKQVNIEDKKHLSKRIMKKTIKQLLFQKKSNQQRAFNLK